MRKDKSKSVPRLVLEESAGQRFLEMEERLNSRFRYDQELLYGSWQESFT
ncbi:hypothetical protein [Cytobacillus praedii]|nr:hypothetical protein [Cytobacillus praedii]